MAFVVTAVPQLGPTLRGLRRARDLSQERVAELSGLRQKTVSLLENDPQRCSVQSLMKYLSAVGSAISLESAAGSEARAAASSGDAW